MPLDKLKVAFRIDASPEIGMGHFVRMSALAEAFAALGHGCAFFTSADEPVDYSAFGVVVLDTYEIDGQYIAALRKPGRVLVCVDDNARLAYDCDVLLNHNFHAQELQFSFSGKPPKLLLGAKYALLRSEFSKTEPITVRDKAVNIFVCFGGSDARNFTPAALGSLREIPGIKPIVVLGEHTRCDADVLALASPDVRVLKNPESMPQIMLSCDMAITAAGSMVYELAALGIPSIVISQAENQHGIEQHLKRTGLMKWLGDWDSVSPAALRKEAESLIHDPERRRAEHRKLIQAVARNGALNAAQEIINTH